MTEKLTQKVTQNNEQKDEINPARLTFYIETYGCQMNEYDSLIAKKLLQDSGNQPVNDPSQADLILLNTCAIRENAHVKIYNRLRQFQGNQNKGAKVGLLGCMPQNLREGLLSENLPIDFIMGPDELRNLPGWLAQAYGGQKDGDQPKQSMTSGSAFLQLSKRETYDDIVPTIEHHLSSKNSTTAFVAIQRGCNNFCTFCVVPYTRGRERSRPVSSIVREVQALQKGGAKSIVLLGQNVNSYRHNEFSFSDLVSSILEETEIERIYFTSPHPKDFPLSIIELMAKEPRFGNLVHMPLQSGSNEVLRAMKRNYTKESFLQLVKQFREMVPDVAITTDVIVGFPGETQSQFLETLQVMEAAQFDSAFMFAYSARKGTIASRRFPDDVPPAEKQRRLEEVIDRQMIRALAMNERFIGREVCVLVESVSKRSDTDLMGRMTNGKKVIFPMPIAGQSADTFIGRTFSVKVTGATGASLRGTGKL